MLQTKSYFLKSIVFFLIFQSLVVNVIGQATIAPSGQLNLCSGESVTLNLNNVPSGANFQWTRNGIDITGATQSSLLVTQDGSYNVKVNGVVTDNAVVIVINQRPNANFTFLPVSGCGKTSISFTNQSDNGSPPSISGLSYTWEFGDGQSSTEANPTHLFNPGNGIGTTTFNVRLIVRNEFNCSDTITKIVTLQKAPDVRLLSDNASSTVLNGEKYFTICEATGQTFIFTNGSSSSSTNTQYIIRWGDGTPDFISNTFNSAVSHNYSVGVKKLTFIVYAGSCVDSTQYNIFVGNVPAGGITGLGGSTICTNNIQKFLISGIANNPSGTFYFLDYRDGSKIDTFIHPAPDTVSHLYLKSSCGTSSSNGQRLILNSFGTYLEIANPCGRAFGSIVPIFVSDKPKAAFNNSKDTICVTQNILFTNTGSPGSNVQNENCDPGKLVWRISSSSLGASWTVTSGNIGSTSNSLNPNNWTAGSQSINIQFNTPGIYQITQISGNNTLCGIDSITKVICVNPTPTANFSTNVDNGCAPLSVTATGNTNIPECSNNRFLWTVSYVPIAGCLPNTSSFNYIGGTNQNSPNPQFEFINPGIYTIELRTVAPGNSCTSTVVRKEITVRGKPVVVINSLENICENTSLTPSATVSCFSTNATYSWTFTGGTPNNSSTLIPGSINYTAAGNYSLSLSATNECGTTLATRNLTVRTTPTVNVPADLIQCAGTSTGNLSFTPSNPGTTFSWTNSNTAIGLAASGSGSVINSFNLVNNTSAPITASITVTPSLNGCQGLPKTFNITVNPLPPTPIVSTPINYCKDDVAVPLTATALIGNTLRWFATASGGTGSVTAPTPNTSTIGDYFFYVDQLTPSNCSSVSRAVILVRVNPIPTFTITSFNPSSCGGNEGRIRLSGLISSQQYTINYTFNNVAQVINRTSTSAGVIEITGLQAGLYTNISVTLNNCKSAEAGPITLQDPNSPTNPIISPISSICSGSNLSLSVSNPIANATYNWTGPGGYTSSGLNTSITRSNAQTTFSGVYTVIAVLNNCSSAVASVNVTVNQTPTAPTTQNVTYCQGQSSLPLNATADPSNTVLWYTSLIGGSSSITPPTPSTLNAGVQQFFVSQRSNDGCESARSTITVTINPTPTISNFTSEICSGSSFNITATGQSSTVFYNWVLLSETGGITGGTNGSGNQITGNLINPTNLPQLAVYKVTPSIGSCIGKDFELTVKVNPRPKLPNYTRTICSGAAFSVEPNSTDEGAIFINGTTYTWSNPVVSPAGSISGALSQSNQQTSISQTLINLTNQIATVTYNVTPRSPISGQCSGDPFQVVITVLPKPSIQNFQRTICSGSSFNVNPSNTPPSLIVPQGTTYTWGEPVSNPVGAISGGLASVTPQANISQTLINNTLSPATLTYTITPATENCVGQSFTITVTVNPQPGISDQQLTICSGNEFVFAPSNIPLGTTFTWGIPVSSPFNAISGGLSSTVPQSTIRQVLRNNTNQPATLTYTVSPSASSCGSTSFSLIVTVNPSPVIPSQQIAICNGSTISFNPLNAPPSVVIPVGTTYTWATPIITPFGLIQGATQQTIPQSLFSQTLINNSDRPGTVTYTITPRSGAEGSCVGAPFQFVSIVNPDVKADFLKSRDTACAPFNINASILSNRTALTSSNNFTWFVNNQIIGTSYNFPGVTISAPNESAVIKLLAKSSFGCKDDSLETRFYTYRKPDVSFSIGERSGCGPLRVTFNNTSSQDPSFRYLWNFGNGQTSTLYQPGSINFQPNPSSGDTTYRVVLLAFNQCDTVRSESFITVSSKPRARFTPSRSTGCSPMRVVFNNTSAGQTNSFTWDFGDGTIRNTSTKDSVSHTFITGVRDTFYVKLIAENDCGRDTSIFPIVVTPNTIRLDVAVSGIEQNGCSPHTVRFFNNSAGATLFRWDFGDGNIQSTTRNIDTITHTFTRPGSYNVQIFASNNCSDTSTTEFIQVFSKPIPDFNFTSLNSCIGDSIQFINQSADNPTSYLWKFGDGNTSTLVNPIHRYTRTGTFQVTLIAFRTNIPGNVCTDSIVRNIVIRDSLPIDFFLSSSVSTCAPFRVSVSTDFQNYSYVEWDFGDGTQRLGPNSSHTYLRSGIYTIRLTVRSSTGCTFTSIKEVRITTPEGSIRFQTGFNCISNPIRFEALPLNTDTIIWNFGDGSELITTNRVVFYQYKNPGSYTPTARFRTRDGCEFNVAPIGDVKIDKLVPGFRIQTKENCGSSEVQFMDSSNAFYGIRSISWNFENGLSKIGDVVSNNYFVTNTYRVQQLIFGNSGCVDTVERSLPIFVRQMPVAQISSDGVICNNSPQLFSSLVQSVDKITFFRWQFSNGAVGDQSNIAITFTQIGNYNVRLIAGTEFGCYDTTTMNFSVNQTPNIIATPPSIIVCKGNSLNLNSSGGSTYTWFPNQGLSCSNCPNPVATPLTSTTYIVKGTSINGCFAFDTVNVKVVQPFKMEFSSNDTICIGESTNLFARGAFNYSWSPSLGLNRNDIPNPVASPSFTTRYRVIGKDEYNCFSDTASMLVAVGQYPVVNLGQDLTLSTGTQQPLTSLITNGPISKWEWSPSLNLSCNNCPQPIATIRNNISYVLKATNIFGCSGSDTLNIKVFCENSQVYIPNAFTPDNDGKNDVFMVRAKGIMQVKSMRIFNRWGQIVFERSNFPPNDPVYGWNGRVNNVEIGPNVFAYTIEVICDDGTPFFYKGNVTLLK